MRGGEGQRSSGVEQRFRDSTPGMPLCALRYKIEPLCQLTKTRFEAKVPFGDNRCFLVRRLFVASFLPWIGSIRGKQMAGGAGTIKIGVDKEHGGGLPTSLQARLQPVAKSVSR